MQRSNSHLPEHNNHLLVDEIPSLRHQTEINSLASPSIHDDGAFNNSNTSIASLEPNLDSSSCSNSTQTIFVDIRAIMSGGQNSEFRQILFKFLHHYATTNSTPIQEINSNNSQYTIEYNSTLYKLRFNEHYLCVPTSNPDIIKFYIYNPERLGEGGGGNIFIVLGSLKLNTMNNTLVFKNKRNINIAFCLDITQLLVNLTTQHKIHFVITPHAVFYIDQLSPYTTRPLVKLLKEIDENAYNALLTDDAQAYQLVMETINSHQINLDRSSIIKKTKYPVMDHNTTKLINENENIKKISELPHQAWQDRTVFFKKEIEVLKEMPTFKNTKGPFYADDEYNHSRDMPITANSICTFGYFKEHRKIPDNSRCLTLLGLISLKTAVCLSLRIAVTYNLFLLTNQIHPYGFLHLDIKPDNCLVDEETGELFLIDPEYASKIGLNEVVARGTPSYVAPEIWRREPTSKETDYFPLGLTLLELWGFERKIQNDNDFFTQIKQFNKKFIIDDNPALQNAVLRIASTMISFNPTQRKSPQDGLDMFLNALKGQGLKLDLFYTNFILNPDYCADKRTNEFVRTIAKLPMTPEEIDDNQDVLQKSGFFHQPHQPNFSNQTSNHFGNSFEKEDKKCIIN